MPRTTLILAAAIACACSACSQETPTGPVEAAAAATTATAAKPVPASTAPDIGIDLSYVDHSVKPGDDFFEYANGAWLKTAKIPADRSSIGAFYDMSKRTEERTADLIENAGKGQPPAGSNARKIADYYAAWMDTGAIEQHGLAPLKGELDAIDGINSRADLARVLGSRLRQDVDPINAYENLVYKDLTNAFNCRRTNEREPVAAQESARDDDLQIVAVTQLHSHIHSIRQNCNSFMKTDAAGNLRRGGSGADSEDVSIAYQFRCDQTNATFFRAALPLLLVVVRDVTKRLIEQRLNRNCAAVAAAK